MLNVRSTAHLGTASPTPALFYRRVFLPWPDPPETPAASIDDTHIRDLLARMVHMSIGRQTHVLRSYLQANCTHGAHANLDPRRPASESSRFILTGNPVTSVPRITEFESVRDRVLSDAELRGVWVGINSWRSTVALAWPHVGRAAQRHHERHDFLVEKAAALAMLESHIAGMLEK